MNYIKRIFVFLILIINIMFFLFPKTILAKETIKVDSPVALLMDLKTGKILYEKDKDRKMYPASLTKVMTAIVVLENCDLNEVATVSYNAVMSLSSGYVTANLQAGEELTVEQLLYVLMVGSSNDAAIVLAEHVAGSVEDFADLMNEKATQIGCTSTHFVNPNGVHDENHYSTAYDLALIAKYAMQNQTFRNLVSTTSYTLPATEKYERNDRLFTTTNSLLIVNNNDRADNYYYKYATGIKTGFTTPAGNCLIASANKNGLDLLTVILDAGQTSSGLSSRYLDTIDLFEYGYDNYVLNTIVQNGGVVQSVKISNATRDTKYLDAVVANDVSVLVKKSEKDNPVLPEVTLNENLKAPIKKGDVIGTAKYTVDGIEYTENLIANSDVKKSHLFFNILIILFLLVIVHFYLKNRRKKLRNIRLKKRLHK